MQTKNILQSASMIVGDKFCFLHLKKLIKKKRKWAICKNKRTTYKKRSIFLKEKYLITQLKLMLKLSSWHSGEIKIWLVKVKKIIVKMKKIYGKTKVSNRF